MYLAALAGGKSRNNAVAGAAAKLLTYFHADEAARINALATQLADTTSPAFRVGKLIGNVLIRRTVTPPGHWNAIAVGLVEDANFSTLGTARLFATLNTAQADAFIACWDAKYSYWSLRPVTAVRRLIDPNWLSYIATPPFPSFVSGHSTTSGAAATVLAGFFPERAAELAALAGEAAVSRLYGGIHYRSDNVVGLGLGRRIGQVALHAYHVDPPVWIDPRDRGVLGLPDYRAEPPRST
jgi:membrane-associated phospholipid phosphatase